VISHAQSSSCTNNSKIINRVLSARPKNICFVRAILDSSISLVQLFNCDIRFEDRHIPLKPELTNLLSLTWWTVSLMRYRRRKFSLTFLNLLIHCRSWLVPKKWPLETLRLLSRSESRLESLSMSHGLLDQCRTLQKQSLRIWVS